MVSENLLSILVCPVCRSKVEPKGEGLVCVGCGLTYPIRNGIPIMLVEEAVRPDVAGEPTSIGSAESD